MKNKNSLTVQPLVRLPYLLFKKKKKKIVPQIYYFKICFNFQDNFYKYVIK